MSTSQPRTRRERQKAETRQELIETAGRVFSKRGFQHASVERIARTAGYSTGAIYWHFGGKDELFLAVFEEYALTRVRELGRIYEKEQGVGDLADRMRVFADHWMERHANDTDFTLVALEFFVHALRHPELREALATGLAAVRLAVARLLEVEAEQIDIELPLPADELATVMRELGIGLALAKMVDPEAVRDELYGDFVELFFRLVLSAD